MKGLRNSIILIASMAMFIGIPACVALKTPDSSDNTLINNEVDYVAGNSSDVGEPSDMSGYTFLDQSKANCFINSSFESVVNMFINETSGIVFIGYTGCEWCQRAVPVVADLGQEKNSIIYYVNVANEDSTGDSYKQFKALAKEVLEEDDVGEKRLMVPVVIGIKDGKIVDYHVSTVDSFEIEDETSNLNEEQHDELLSYYEEIYDKVYN